MDLYKEVQIEDILFLVELKPIYMMQNDSKMLINRESMIKIPRFKSLVDLKKNKIIAIVSNGYKLITNKEALDLGHLCFETVFGKGEAFFMSLFNIILPRSRSFCHVDYMHDQSTFYVSEDDRWIIFLRITNSYNKTKSLKFDIGFCRWICRNGIIFGKQSVTFRYIHTHSKAKNIIFKSNIGNLEEYKAQFIEKIHNLKRYYIPKNLMLPLICKVFNIFPKAEDKKDKKRWEKFIKFRELIQDLTSQYFDELGPNGYAAMNVITDYAGRPNLYISQANMIDILQKKSGDWTDDFLAKVKQDNFNIEEYLKDYIEPAKLLMNDKGSINE